MLSGRRYPVFVVTEIRKMQCLFFLSGVHKTSCSRRLMVVMSSSLPVRDLVAYDKCIYSWVFGLPQLAPSTISCQIDSADLYSLLFDSSEWPVSEYLEKRLQRIRDVSRHISQVWQRRRLSLFGHKLSFKLVLEKYSDGLKILSDARLMLF